MKTTHTFVRIRGSVKWKQVLGHLACWTTYLSCRGSWVTWWTQRFKLRRHRSCRCRCFICAWARSVSQCKPWDFFQLERWRPRKHHFRPLYFIVWWRTGIGKDLRLDALNLSAVVKNFEKKSKVISKAVALSGSYKIWRFRFRPPSVRLVRLTKCKPAFVNEWSRMRWWDEARWPNPVLFANGRPSQLVSFNQ